MTHTPPESQAWPHAGATERPSASGQQPGRRDPPASDLPAAAAEDTMEGLGSPFPEAGRHEGDTPERSARRSETKDADQLQRDADAAGRSAATGSEPESFSGAPEQRSKTRLI
jgi:hypothetical protein